MLSEDKDMMVGVTDDGMVSLDLGGDFPTFALPPGSMIRLAFLLLVKSGCKVSFKDAVATVETAPQDNRDKKSRRH